MIQRAQLFTSKRDSLLLLLTSFFILTVSLYIEYKNYQEFIVFDSALVDATVLKQYTKTKNNRTYQVLKLKNKEGLVFYTTAKKSLHDIKNQEIELEIWPKDLTFYKYLTTFYGPSKIIDIKSTKSNKQNLNALISSSHKKEEVTNIYQALYTATPLDYKLQSDFSTLGISHLLAISGFHLGVLSALLFFLFRPIYVLMQNRFFPYANANRDIFLLVGATLFIYVLFLDSPPSLIRAFGMLVIGFILYDRGIKIISMQTLFLTILLLLSLFPRLFFSLGFWLSSSGVFYIFLFLIYFKTLKKLWQFLLLPTWVYLLMLPFSLAIFENFSIYHPLSILWTSLFSIFYPLSIFLHVIGIGNLFDSVLLWLLELGKDGVLVSLNQYLFFFYILLSLGAVFSRLLMWALLLTACSIFIYAVYHVA
ncbi:MAG: competence protein ComEC [Sulfurimonas sp.]|nr:MAG: competence protein ComEC [Sulfurimonas sp.]